MPILRPSPSLSPRSVRMKSRALLAVAPLLLMVPFSFARALSAQEAEGEARVEEGPSVILGGVPFSVTLKGADEVARAAEADTEEGAGVQAYEVRTARGASLASGAIGAGASLRIEGLVVESRGDLPLEVRIGSSRHSIRPPFAPGWFAIAPPLLAILLALIFKEVFSALFAGVWLGALAIAGWNPLAAFGRVIDTFAVPALGAGGHTEIVIFSLLLGGMVGIISRNGGTMGIVRELEPVARSPRRGKLATWASGMAVFFDDYANTLIVGNTMRAITDRLRISREKLAYLVDSTAAPVAAIVPISTWAGYEISLIQDGLTIAGGQAADPALADALASSNPLTLFVHTIPYLFYPLLALAFVFLTSFLNRDWGPMARAERRASEEGELSREGAMIGGGGEESALKAKEGIRHRWWNAAAAILAVVVTVLAGLYLTGRAAVSSPGGPPPSLIDIFGESDPFAALLWGSLAGCLTAILLSLVQRLLTLKESIEAMMDGMKVTMVAMVILILAWSLGAVTEEVGTAQYLSGALNDVVPLPFVPVLVFVIAAAIAFATGTSWGTMAILIPLVIPLTVSLGGGSAVAGGADYPILLGAVSSVLAGAIFGDHCSPISDTTVLSSMASRCDHVDHVRTQLPYALLVAVVAMLVGDVPTAFGLPPWISLVVGVGALYLFLRIWGVPTGAKMKEGEIAA